MTEHRARAQDLVMADAMPHCQHFEYVTTLPLEEAINDKFFLPVANNLRPGDQIALVSFDRPQGPQHNGRVLEIATVRVVEKRPDAVEVFQIGEIVHVPRRDANGKAQQENVPRERFVPGDAKVAWNVSKRAYDIKVGSKVLASEPDQDKAKAIARGDVPLPAEPETVK